MIRAILILALVGIAHADQWEFFYPQTVTKYGCRVMSVDSHVHGSREPSETVWMANAWAERSDKALGDWGMNIGQFPYTNKGRHQAEKACSAWQDVAESKVNPPRRKQ